MKKILVTGTSSGIGLVTAKLLAQSGYYVYANIRNREHAKIFEGMSNIDSICFDVRDIESIKKVASQIDGKLFAIVNNAGISYWSPLLDVPQEIFEDVLNTNLYGALNVYKVFFDKLSRDDSRIINITSVSGKLIFPHMGPYHVSKAALETLSDSLRREHKLAGLDYLKTTIIEPGSVDTRLWERARNTTIFPKSSIFYESAYKVGHGIIEQESRVAFSPMLVAKAILGELKSADPKIRVVVGPQSWLYKILMLFPDWLFDKLLILLTKKYLK